jgi:hypothetical protein
MRAVEKDIARILYRLKYQFGRKAVLMQLVSGNQDLSTGSVSRDYWLSRIRNCIELPRRITTEFTYDLSYIAAGKNFTEGGFYDKTSGWLLIDYRELKHARPVSMDDLIQFKGRRLAKVSELIPTSTDMAIMMRVQFVDNYTIPDMPSYFVYDEDHDTSNQRLMGGFTGSGPEYQLEYHGETYLLNTTAHTITCDGTVWESSDVTGAYVATGEPTLRVRSLR